MIKNKILIILSFLLSVSINSYAVPLDVVKPDIKNISYYSGRWHISYSEVQNGTNLKSEELFVDGMSDRVVNIGTLATRAFPMIGAYTQNECHKAYIVIYDTAHISIAQSDIFNFGDIDKCNGITDTTNPVISLNGANPQKIIVGSAYTELGATAFDNSDGDITGDVTIDATEVDTSVVGDYLVTYSVVDAAGNDTIVTRTVNVIAANVVSPIEILAVKYYSGKWNIAYKDLQASSNLSIEKLFVDGALDRQVNAGTTIASLRRGFRLLGTYDPTTCHEAHIVIFDNANQEVTRTANFNFGDTTACGDMIKPVITLVGANPQIINVGETYTELGATATDDVDGDIGAIIIDTTTVDTAVAGTYTVTYNVVDAANNVAVTVSRTVTVQDVVAVDIVKPVITLVGKNPQVINVGETYTELGATATDDVDGDITGDIVIDTTTVDTAVAGTYTVTYNVADTATNSAITVARTVRVEEVVTLPSTEIIAIQYYSGQWNIVYTDLALTTPNLGLAKVFVDGTLDRQVNAGTSIESRRRGFRLIGDYAQDACHEAYVVISDNANNELTRTATFNFGDTTKCGEDMIKPIITLKGSNPQELTIGDAYVELGAEAFDNRDGNISGNLVIDSTAVDTGTVGTYSVTYNVLDTAKNAAVAVTRTVNVIDIVDVERPVITLIGATPQELLVGETYIELGATAIDDIDGDISGNILIDSTAVDTNSVGQYFVSYSVSDQGGNSRLVKRSVIVKGLGTINGDYYISVDGNDNNDGKSLATAFKTIKHAFEVASGGDTILMKGGVYREGRIRVKKENNTAQYITLQNYNNEKVVIKGSKTVSNWVHYQDNIWKLPTTNMGDLNRSVHYQQVFYGEGKSLQKIGYPNYLTYGTTNVWTLDRKFIPIKEDANNPFGMSEGTFYVEKLENGTFDLYVWLPNGKTPNDADVNMEVSDEQYLLDVSSLNYLKLKGLVFMHTASAATASYTNGYQAGYGLSLGYGAIMEDCEVAYTDFSGIYISLSTLARATDMKQRLSRNKFHHNGAIGITAVSGGYLIEDSEFYSNATRPFIQYWHTGSIKTAAQGWGEIKNNYFHDERANGIWFDYCYSGQPILVHHNYLDKIGVLPADPLTQINPRGHGLFFEQSNNIKAYNNIVNMVQQRGIYISNSEDVIITNNLINKSLLQQIGLSDDSRTHLKLKNIKIFNNILAENRQSKNNSYDIMFFHGSGMVGAEFEVSNELKNNIIYNSNGIHLLYTESGNWTLDDNIKVNPQLSTNGSTVLTDWNLGVQSPALNSATFYDFIVDDYYHNPRNDGVIDIGPFEK